MIDNDSPRISVGLPVYNGEDFLRAAVDSILCQTFLDFELIITDNGSTDATEKVCRQYEAADSRVRYYRYEQNRGAAWNFNNAFAKSRGEFFQWAAHDDLYNERFLESAVQVLDDDPRIVLTFAGTDFIDEDGATTRSYKFPIDVNIASMRKVFFVYATGTHIVHEIFGLIRSDHLRSSPLIGGYPGSDKVLLGYLALRGAFHQIPSTLFFHREHPGRSTKAAAGAKNSAQWFDASKSGRFSLPFLRCSWENAKVVLRSHIEFRKKLQCLFDIARALNWNRGRLSKEILDVMKRGVSKT